MSTRYNQLPSFQWSILPFEQEQDHKMLSTVDRLDRSSEIIGNNDIAYSMAKIIMLLTWKDIFKKG